MLKLFSIYDSKAEAFIQPFFSPATGSAIRSFETAANDAGSDFHKYGADYTLFEIGTFDEHTCELTPLESKINLGLAITFLRPIEAPMTAYPEIRKDMLEQRQPGAHNPIARIDRGGGTS